MNTMLCNGMIIENRDTQNLAYILQSPHLFFLTGYKVLQNQEKNGFIKCTKVSHNGKDKLVYDIAKYKTLESILNDLRPETLLILLINLFELIDVLKKNGFMKCENIEIDFDKIFVDCNNYKVHLIYLPIENQSNQDSEFIFEHELKMKIIQSISNYSNLTNPLTFQLCEKLKSSTNSIESISVWLKDAYNNDTNTNTNTNTNTKPNQMEAAPIKIEQTQPNTVLNSYNNPFKQTPPSQDQQKKKTLFQGLFKPNRKENQENTYAINFKSEIAGGYTEVLSDLFIPSIILSGVGTPQLIEIPITKPEFIIGKNPGAVDGVIQFNSAISRIHCKIIFIEGRYFILDLGSANGTYVNETKVIVNQHTPLNLGDMVRLANSNFFIKSARGIL